VANGSDKWSWKKAGIGWVRGFAGANTGEASQDRPEDHLTSLTAVIGYRFTFRRGASSKPSNRQKAKPTALWPWLSTYCRWISRSVQCRRTPSIIDATSDDEHRLNWE